MSSHLIKIIEIILVIWIASSLFYDPATNYSRILQPLLTTNSKFIIILAIIASSWLDLQLAIILTIAFFILIISFNKKTILNSPAYKELFSKTRDNNSLPVKPYQSIRSVSAKYDPDEVLQENTPERICNVAPYDPESINSKLFELRRDPKFDDYDEYVNMLSSSEQIQSAQDNVIKY